MALSTAVDVSAVARTLGIKTTFKNLRGGRTVYLPQRVAVIGQGASASTFSTTKRQVTSATEVGSLYGYGSPVHLATRQLFPVSGDGVGSIPVTIYPLEDDGSGVAAAGDITPSGTQTESANYYVYVNNIRSEAFTIAAAQTVAATVTAITAAINAVPEMPVIATDSTTTCDLEAKWAGASGNDIYIEVEGSTTAGTTFAVTQPTGGATNPGISDALAQVGDVWETMIVNCLELEDTTTLGLYSAWGEGRWGALTRRPAVVFTGNSESTYTGAITIPDARKTDRTNCAVPNPGGNDLPLVIAARTVARVAVTANNNPPMDYARSELTGLTPGPDGTQWTYPQRDAAVKGGSSTVIVKDSVVNLADLVTFYHPTGDPTPAYRYVVDIVKVMNVLFNLDLIFNTAEWDGAPLIPDNQATNNKSAKKPKMAVAEICALWDNLALDAIISDPDFAKASTFAGISSSNPKRLDVDATYKISGNAGIISVDANWGFYFGGA